MARLNDVGDRARINCARTVSARCNNIIADETASGSDRTDAAQNGNTNRLLRQYFPKGLDMSAFSQAKLSVVARQLNERLRKNLQYQTPAEKFETCVAATR